MGKIVPKGRRGPNAPVFGEGGPSATRKGWIFAASRNRLPRYPANAEPAPANLFRLRLQAALPPRILSCVLSFPSTFHCFPSLPFCHPSVPPICSTFTLLLAHLLRKRRAERPRTAHRLRHAKFSGKSAVIVKSPRSPSPYNIFQIQSNKWDSPFNQRSSTMIPFSNSSC